MQDVIPLDKWKIQWQAEDCSNYFRLMYKLVRHVRPNAQIALVLLAQTKNIRKPPAVDKPGSGLPSSHMKLQNPAMTSSVGGKPKTAAWEKGLRPD